MSYVPPIESVRSAIEDLAREQRGGAGRGGAVIPDTYNAAALLHLREALAVLDARAVALDELRAARALAAVADAERAAVARLVAGVARAVAEADAAGGRRSWPPGFGPSPQERAFHAWSAGAHRSVGRGGADPGPIDPAAAGPPGAD